MKKCSQCNQMYFDDSLNFCLSDGGQLVFVSDSPSEETVLRSSPFNPSEETVIRSTPFNPLIPQPAPSVKQGVSPMFAYLAIALLVLLVGGAVALLIMFNLNSSPTVKKEIPNTNFNSSETNSNKNKEQLDEEKAELKEKQDSLEKEKQRLADERKKLEAEKDKPVETPTPDKKTYYDPPTARIRFNRGSVSGGVSGSISSQRSFVLQASSGQYLSANVSSGSGCVTFKNGSTNTGYVTNSGDNYVYLVNNCGDVSSFSLTVSIR